MRRSKLNVLPKKSAGIVEDNNVSGEDIALLTKSF
jgi:hypothetical protein